jgi:hypothetical protein
VASQAEIANVALTLLGSDRIISLDDDIKPAREIKAMFNISRDALLAGYDWSFAKTRSNLSALTSTPANGFDYEFQIPSDCLRLVMVGEHYVGMDLTDYRGSPVEEFTIEGRTILTNLAAPLPVIYIKRVTDTTQFQANFTKGFAAQLAMDVCEALTQSETKRARAERELSKEITLAIRANAIELPPRKLPDDEWLMSRR